MEPHCPPAWVVECLQGEESVLRPPQEQERRRVSQHVQWHMVGRRWRRACPVDYQLDSLLDRRQVSLLGLRQASRPVPLPLDLDLRPGELTVLTFAF